MKIETECDVCGKTYKADQKDLKKGFSVCSKQCEKILNNDNSKKQSKVNLDSLKYKEYKES